jgi:hypothetical protein
MSNLMLVGKPMATAIKRFCPSIARISWKSNYGFSTQPKMWWVFSGLLPFERPLHWEILALGWIELTPKSVFELCHSIERLSIKDCILHDYGIRDGSNRTTPRRYHSDASKPSVASLAAQRRPCPNVAMLQQELPEITFVSE